MYKLIAKAIQRMLKVLFNNFFYNNNYYYYFQDLEINQNHSKMKTAKIIKKIINLKIP